MTMTITASKPHRRVLALDGMRAVSILLVVFSHLGLGKYLPGAFGVTLFFFISGYLISGQLVNEFEHFGTIDFKRFYLRRFFRLIPAAFVFVLVSGATYRYFDGNLTIGGWAAAFLYYANYYDIFVHYDSLGNHFVHPLHLIWSLTVEEHFYLVFPVVLALTLSRPGSAIRFIIAACIVELAWRYFLYDQCFLRSPSGICGVDVADRIYKATDTRFDSLLFGVFLTLRETRRRALHLATGSFAELNLAALAIAFGLLAVSFVSQGGLNREVFRYTEQGLALLIIVPAILGTRRLEPIRHALESRAAVFVGRLSYSIYLWHWLAIGLVNRFLFNYQSVRGALSVIVLTGFLSLLSYYCVEQPFLGLRRRFGSHAPANLGKDVVDYTAESAPEISPQPSVIIH